MECNGIVSSYKQLDKRLWQEKVGLRRSMAWSERLATAYRFPGYVFQIISGCNTTSTQASDIIQR